MENTKDENSPDNNRTWQGYKVPENKEGPRTWHYSQRNIYQSNNNHKTRLPKMFNEILKQDIILGQWISGNITRLYTGKRTKGKCSNEIGSH